MKAICVTPERTLEVRDIPSPAEAAPGHLLVDMEASAINHGDKTFLRLPNAAGAGLPAVGQGVWGASGAGTVRAIGAGVPADYLGRQVAIYRSLTRSAETIGLWSEQAQVPWTSCLILPQTVRARDYCGSLVNVMTAHAFLEEIVAAGHRGVIVTAGNSATGRALGALARARKLPAILLVRHAEAAEALRREGEPHVVAAGRAWSTRSRRWPRRSAPRPCSTASAARWRARSCRPCRCIRRSTPTASSIARRRSRSRPRC
ncbi:hypothetical protein [Burkholderia gladioli]|uniref:hypothetical protein n=1 Tax=Burkholderia gladioli TaxID=28095 RepID=UPI001C82DEFD|nr:hypothetical protein [Burkholderia gladioli]